MKYYIIGFFAGILNGFFGTGGGLLVVPMLEHTELEPKKAHATSIAIILPLSLISGIGYLINGIRADVFTLGVTIPFGIIGAVLGAFLLMKLKNKWLKKGFAIVMIVSAIRLLLR